MDEIILEERVINKFPAPYCLNSTPYLQPDFSEKTRRRCLNEDSRRKKISKDDWLNISKVIIIGDVSVGKTCLVNRYCRRFFENSYKSTIGVDFEIEKFCILGVPFILQIWDTAGQERFKSIAQSYYRGANVVIIAFDLTNCHSLSNCKKWLSEALNANLGKDPFVFLVGTKKDLLNDFSYKNIRSSAINLAQEINAEYWSVSSKTGKNVNTLFRRIASLSFEEVLKKEFEFKRGAIFIGDKLLDEEPAYDTKISLERNKRCCNN